MKKIFISILLNLIFFSTALSEEFYFKNCVISNAVIGNYIIDVEKKIIKVELKALNGKTQNFTDKIKKIEKNKIISEKIKSEKGKDFYYQYFLDTKSKSVIKLQYKKESGVDISVFNLFEKRESFCKEIKTGWNKKKIESAQISKEQEKISKEQEKLKMEQSKLSNCEGSDYKLWNNCKGSYKSKTGHKYTGLFMKGLIIEGISLYPGGAKYVGAFKNFEPDGYGTFVWQNGDKYFGEWRDGKSHGTGTKVWSDGRKYLGDFENDQMHGEGTFFYPDGKKYSGGFMFGKRHGQGTFTYDDGSAYIGKFNAGKEEGVGECINKEGESKICKSKSDVESKEFVEEDVLKIKIVAKKWVRISQYEKNIKKSKTVTEKLNSDFETKAKQLCNTNENYKILRKIIEVLEVDETPAYGLETKVKLGINGIIKCI